MNYGKYFFSVLVGTAVIVYLISSFLIASFNIALWQDGHRFFAVLVYIILVIKLLDTTADNNKGSNSKKSTQNDIVEREAKAKVN